MTDGVDHINVYSKGQTALGRALSNFAHLPVTTPDGRFASIEGYWYWLSTPATESRRDELRAAHGWVAKQLGRELRGMDWCHRSDFKLRIIAAMVSKLLEYPTLCNELAKSTLPFRHYYLYGDKRVEPKDGEWIIETWEHLRRVVKA